MLINIVYILLALLGIGFLIFIHELGHYFMARKVGIKVEAFAIGFGKALIQWEKDGVKWKIGWLPFGGYVKMAGMEKQGPIEPYQIEDGFFGKKPWARIKVAAMGPIVNIVFAFVAFTFIWASGGRDKSFSEFTHHIGWVDRDSDLYKAEIRPGDEITKLNSRPFKNFNDFLQSAALDNQALSMGGYEIDYQTGQRTPFTYTFNHRSDLDGVIKAQHIASILNPAQYLLFKQLEEGSPMTQSGISKGDRIVWVDGRLVFSHRQLRQVLNQNTILLTVQREGQIFLSTIPLLQMRDLRLTTDEKGEFDDWRSEAKLSERIEDLLFIPYNINGDGIVENPLSYIDDRSQSKLSFEPPERIPSAIPLMRGDKILAASGKLISNGYELLKEIQTPVSLIVVRKETEGKPLNWKEADKDFVASFEMQQLESILKSIGTGKSMTRAGNLTLLAPIKLIPMTEFPLSPEQSQKHQEKIAKHKKNIEQISDPERKEEAEKFLEFYQNRRTLGIYFDDKQVTYNPPPYVLFSDVFKEIYRTLFALISGFLSPKHMAGPIGIIQVMHHGWTLGFNEALFWLGMISLNLGLINLLPIPVLDGGHIVFSLWEMVTKKPLKAKTMERLIIPFVILLVALFIYLTYNDIVRIIKSLF